MNIDVKIGNRVVAVRGVVQSIRSIPTSKYPSVHHIDSVLKVIFLFISEGKDMICQVLLTGSH